MITEYFLDAGGWALVIGICVQSEQILCGVPTWSEIESTCNIS